jgi:hypothetical protein
MAFQLKALLAGMAESALTLVKELVVMIVIIFLGLTFVGMLVSGAFPLGNAPPAWWPR